MDITLFMIILLLSTYFGITLIFIVFLSIYAYINNKNVEAYKLERKADLRKICLAFDSHSEDSEKFISEVKSFCKKYDYTSYDTSFYISGDYNKDEVGYPCCRVYFYRGQKVKICLNATTRKYRTSKNKVHKLY